MITITSDRAHDYNHEQDRKNTYTPWECVAKNDHNSVSTSRRTDTGGTNPPPTSFEYRNALRTSVIANTTPCRRP